MGGEEAFKQNLDALFNAREDEGTSDMTGLIGQYVQGNEPDQHVPYLYNYTDTPWKTQEIVDEILDEFYLPTPEGIVGNEDVGAMSAWYVMSAPGLLSNHSWGCDLHHWPSSVRQSHHSSGP